MINNMLKNKELTRKIKVLLVASYGGVPGGISRWTEHLMKYYSEFGQEECEISLVPMGRSSFININSPKIYRLKEAIKDYSGIIMAFKRKLKCGNYDVMHLTSSASWSLIKDLYLIKKAKRHGIKTIIHFHFGRIPDLAQSKNWEWKLLTRVLKLSDCVIVLDKRSLTVLNELGYINVVSIPNPVSPQVLSIVSSNQLERVPRTIIFCGHVVKTKGVFELLDACSNIQNIRLKMVGHVVEDMRLAINEYAHLPSCLEMVGELPYEEVIKEMLKSDLMVLPSYTEGFPNVILEGMATGCAIVATEVGAIPQMLEEENKEQYGIIIKPQDVKCLEQAIVFLLNNPDEKEAMRRRAQKRVQERYGMDSVWKEIRSLWCNLSDPTLPRN